MDLQPEWSDLHGGKLNAALALMEFGVRQKEAATHDSWAEWRHNSGVRGSVR